MSDFILNITFLVSDALKYAQRNTRAFFFVRGIGRDFKKFREIKSSADQNAFLCEKFGVHGWDVFAEWQYRTAHGKNG